MTDKPLRKLTHASYEVNAT